MNVGRLSIPDDAPAYPDHPLGQVAGKIYERIQTRLPYRKSTYVKVRMANSVGRCELS
jgi:hypothetical protein